MINYNARDIGSVQLRGGRGEKDMDPQASTGWTHRHLEDMTGTSDVRPQVESGT